MMWLLKSWLWLVLFICLGNWTNSESVNTNVSSESDDDYVQAEFFNEPSPYIYDEHALKERWVRDLSWDEDLDHGIRSRHQGFVEADDSRRLSFNLKRSNFIKKLYRGNPNKEVSCFIGYKSLKGRQEVILAAFNTTYVKHDFTEANSIAVTLPKWKLIEILEDKENIDFIEEDQTVLPNQVGGEEIPYGIRMSQGGASFAHNRPNSCKKPRSMKVAIIDSGYTVGHPDLTCSTLDAPNCIGSSFGLSENEQWHNPVVAHGTHVAGTIGALGNNNAGVVGMVPDDDICYLIARVFGEVGGAPFSQILAAVDWSIKNGARVINMSLSGDRYDTTAARVFEDAFIKQNRIMVAAAGNNGNSICRYPACYPSVVSVAAIDSTGTVASFSNYNEFVDLAAPGVSVLSTTPGSTIVLTAQSDTFLPRYMSNSPSVGQGGISGQIIPCGAGKTRCKRGQICLIKRGGNTFEEKALNCQRGGGRAAIIFNNETGAINGWIPADGQVNIPVFGVELSVGRILRKKYRSTQVTIAPKVGGYGTLSGTSMAAPHVTGAVAAIWRSCPRCRNKAIVSCLERTAKDLGAPGKDIYYGHGLIQTEDALLCLKNVRGCC